MIWSRILRVMLRRERLGSPGHQYPGKVGFLCLVHPIVGWSKLMGLDHSGSPVGRKNQIDYRRLHLDLPTTDSRCARASELRSRECRQAPDRETG